MTTHPFILGITGRKRSGKDTFADVAQQHLESLGWKVARSSFADEIKEQVLQLKAFREYNVRLAELELPENKEEIRPMYIAYGNYIRKHRNPAYWLNLTMSRVVTFCRENPTNSAYIIPDVRFINETKAIRAMGGFVFKVINPLETNQEPEAEIDEIKGDYTVKNCFSELYNEAVRQAVKEAFKI